MGEKKCDDCRHYDLYTDRSCNREFELCSYEINDGIIVDKEIPYKRTCQLWKSKGDRNEK